MWQRRNRCRELNEAKENVLSRHGTKASGPSSAVRTQAGQDKGSRQAYLLAHPISANGRYPRGRSAVEVEGLARPSSLGNPVGSHPYSFDAMTAFGPWFAFLSPLTLWLHIAPSRLDRITHALILAAALCVRAYLFQTTPCARHRRNCPISF